ncbi:hypothetical protein GCM10010400_13560 [Streptomyces aculeolatus]|uniref:hypothetical protein n=1 Tax=Streptomyces aculeolatus TaxID=270689 RepID=UPI00036D3335|nr:hypothetical protein [Streptomyces aculeolatus]
MPVWLIVVVVVLGAIAALNLAAFALDRRGRRSEAAWRRTLPDSVRRRMESGPTRDGGVDTPPWVAEAERRRRETDPDHRMRLLVAELIEIGLSRGFLTRTGKDRRTREIGAELHRMGGKRRMVRAHDDVQAVLGRGPDRELELAWDGIGDWLG